MNIGAKIIVAAAVAAAFAGETFARPKAGMAFYDVDALYDTIPSKFYDDSRYTPRGAMRWNTERYMRRTKAVAEMTDSLALPLVALFGVENEQVVRDIASACNTDYTYIHRTSNRLDGLDFALLYFSDRFFPESIDTGLDYMYITGRLDDMDIGLLICDRPRMLDYVIEEIRDTDPERLLIVTGNLYRDDLSRFALADATLKAESEGRGTRPSRSGWYMRSRIYADTRLTVRADVYARRRFVEPLLADRRRGSLYGRSLPLFAYITH